MSKKNILGEYSSFKPSTWNYLGLDWIVLFPNDLYRNDRQRPWNISKFASILFHSADEDISFGGNLDRLNFRVVLHHTGKNVWLAPVTFKSKCRINIKYFPFDTQYCKMKFGSWTYDGYRLDILNESHSADLGNYIESAEWDLVGVPSVRNVLKYFCCEEPFPDVTFTLIIRRRSLFYMMNLILPLVIITVLINVSFILPAESGRCFLMHMCNTDCAL